MKIATYLSGGVERAGVVEADRVYAFEPGTDVPALLESGLDAALALGRRAVAGDGVALADVRLRPPLRPVTVRDFVAFAEHVEGVRRSIDGVAGVPDAWYDAPAFYFTNPHTVVGHGDDVVFPAACAARDFEVEVAVVLGGGGRDLSVEQARDVVFGYTVFNDWSARDLQRREMQVNLGPAKGKDFAGTLGPWIVTADELDGYRDVDGFLDLWCIARVNDVEIGRDLLSNMGWTFESLIAYASRDSRVLPGDVLGSGTVGNGGCLAELWGRNGEQSPPPLQPGDTVTVTVQGIGSISNRVVVGAPAPALPTVRRRDPARARTARLAEAARYEVAP
jgi:2-keto-4-pentenoate hydratase/2-oxohepta-3-ene-1,7-dioic acid hydratase in catechol pathway